MTDAQAPPQTWGDTITEYIDGYGFTGRQSIIPTLKDFERTVARFYDVRSDNYDAGEAWERTCVGACYELDPVHVHDYDEPGRGRYKIWRLRL